MSQQPDRLDEAFAALQHGPIPPGPADTLLERTRAALVSARPSPFLLTRRRIMQTAISLAAGLAVAATLWLAIPAPSAAGLTYADVAKRLNEAQTVSYRVRVDPPLDGAAMTHRCWFRANDRMRIELPDGYATIVDLKEMRTLGLDPKLKQAYLMTTTPGGQPGKGEALSDTATELKKMAKRQGEPAGERELGGVKVPGFKLAGDPPITVWADPKTGLPLRMEMQLPVQDKVRTLILDEFVFNAPLADDFFPLVPPPGYTVIEIPNLFEQPLGEAVADLLRAYAQAHDGKFPAKLTDWAAYIPVFTKNQKDGQPSPEALRAATRLGMLTAALTAMKPDQFGYHGEGVGLGAKDTIIFWYRDPKTTKSMALYGDLRLAEVKADQLPKRP